MGHALYCFLIRVVPKDGDTDEQLADRACLKFDNYIADFGDSDNWYEIYFVMFREGHMIYYNHAQEYKSVPAVKRWGMAINLAHLCVEGECLDHIESLGIRVPEKEKYTLAELRSYLADGIIKVGEQIQGGATTAWRISAAARLIDQIDDMIGDDLPFTTTIYNPYDSIRAVDLRDEYENGIGEHDVILVADIHT